MNEPPWLQDAVDRALAFAERLPHGLLVQGPAGWGEERVANALAVALMGLKPGSAAREVAHPDLRWLEPEGAVIKIDAVRRIIDFLSQTPQRAGRKVAVIEDADRMNIHAANALLKSLEEPPAESFVVLSTGAPERLLPTVRSRCQRIEVHPARAAVATPWLVEAGVDAELANQLAVECGGAPFAVRNAAERGQLPLWPELAKVGRNPAVAAEVAEARRDENLADIAGRWLRIVHQLARSQPPEQVVPVLDFAAELSHVRRAALSNTGLNRVMQLHRLLLLWGELWPRLDAARSAG